MNGGTGTRPAGIRLLLVDDNGFDRELAVRALRGLPGPPGPAEVVSVGDWAEALRHLEAAPLDLLLLDYNLPGITGLEILRLLRTRSSPPPVIMMTGQDDIATAVETLRAGAYDYVSKGAAWGASLCLAVERVLERVRLERELAQSRAWLAAHAAELEHKVAARTAMMRAQAAQIETLYLKAEEAARVKSEIVANVSHELRTPLNVILGYTELLAEQMTTDGPPEAGAILAKVRSQADRLRQLIDSLLALNRLHTGREGIVVSRFPLAGLLDELEAEARALSPDPGLTFRWKAPPEPCEVENDREKVRAIAYHLLSNAIKFTPAGEIEVTAATTADGGIVLTVSDTGIGLPPEAKALVFEEFRQLDGSSTRRYEGLGLGLGIAKRYTAMLQGTVRLDSVPSGGTTVVVALPGRRVATDPGLAAGAGKASAP